MENDQISGFKAAGKSAREQSFRQILENVSPERIDMLVAEIGEIRDRMAENAKSLVDQTTFRGEVQGSIRVIQWLATGGVVVGLSVGGAMISSLITLNDLKSHMAEMPSPVQLEIMKENISDLRDRINNLENRPPSDPKPAAHHH